MHFAQPHRELPSCTGCMPSVHRTSSPRGASIGLVVVANHAGSGSRTWEHLLLIPCERKEAAPKAGAGVQARCKAGLIDNSFPVVRLMKLEPSMPPLPACPTPAIPWGRWAPAIHLELERCGQSAERRIG